jgi:hypothetical protein
MVGGERFPSRVVHRARKVVSVAGEEKAEGPCISRLSIMSRMMRTYEFSGFSPEWRIAWASAVRGGCSVQIGGDWCERQLSKAILRLKRLRILIQAQLIFQTAT